MVLIIMQFTEDMGMGIIPNMQVLTYMYDGEKILGCMKITAINLQKYVAGQAISISCN